MERGTLSSAEAGEVRRWLEELETSAGPEKARAASELGRLGVATRRSVRTRGSLDWSAPERLPEPRALMAMVEALHATDPDTRSHAAAALGEWGGDDAARALSDLLRSERDETVVLYGVTALRTIGGPDAVDALTRVIAQGTDAARNAAISALEELVTGGPVDDTEAPILTAKPTAPTPRRETTRTRGPILARGAIRTRGAIAGPRRARTSDAVAEALRNVRDGESATPYLRVRAAEVLRHFAR